MQIKTQKRYFPKWCLCKLLPMQPAIGTGSCVQPVQDLLPSKHLLRFELWARKELMYKLFEVFHFIFIERHCLVRLPLCTALLEGAQVFVLNRIENRKKRSEGESERDTEREEERERERGEERYKDRQIDK